MSDAEKSAVTPHPTPMRVPKTGKGLLRVGNPGNKGRQATVVREKMLDHLDREVLTTLMAKWRKGEVDHLELANYLAKFGLAEPSIAKTKVYALIGSWRAVLEAHNAPKAMIEELSQVTNEWELKL